MAPASPRRESTGAAPAGAGRRRGAEVRQDREDKREEGVRLRLLDCCLQFVHLFLRVVNITLN
jgi:hypothetical protein